MQARIIALSLALMALSRMAQAQLPPVGQWRDHLPYHSANALALTPGKVWCATPYSVFSIDTDDNTIERFSKINGLSETGITAIGAFASANQLVIAYHNSRVDILEEGHATTVDDIKNATISGDKAIRHVFCTGTQAWLSTGLGIIVLDLGRAEVKDTWIIGSTGQQTAVFATTGNSLYIYAATAEGLKRASLNGPNLADFRNWQNLSGSNGLPAGPVQSVVTQSGQLVVLKNDSVYQFTNGQWNFLYADEWTIRHIGFAGNHLLLSETLNTTGRITELAASGTIARRLQHNSYTQLPKQSLLLDGQYWIADSLSGLAQYNGANFQSFVPNSPYSIATGPLQVANNTLWVAAGSVSNNWEPTNNRNGFYKMENDTWTNYRAPVHPALDTVRDFMAIAANPLDQSLWAGSYGGGLLNLRPDNTLTIYKQASPLKPAYFAPNSYRVSGLTFDAANNLWMSNYGGNQQVAVRKADGQWQSFFIPYTVTENAVGPLLIDDFDQKWIIAPKGNGLFCFSHGTTIDNPADDQWRWYRNGQGNGNLPDNQVLSIAKDKNGFIWAGTAKGIGIIQCPQEAFTSNWCQAILPIVQQDNFAGYLFSGEQVQAIAVDGADRKWIGTQNGVWLISPDGEKNIYRFTAENSPLVSNNVNNIAIDGHTGEVFFSTDKGICSFRSTATEGTTTNSQVLVFPNPVPPGYTGTIAIRGVVNNAIVKIAEPNGRLVYQTRALGGQATWNGKDYTGRTISTGIYLVLVSDDNKQEKLVTKIAFIKK